MRKIYFLIPFVFLNSAFAEGPLFSHKEPEKQQEFENTYQDIRKIDYRTNFITYKSTNTRGCLDDPTLCVDTSSHNLYVGIGPVSGSTTAVSGGALTAGVSYYYKIWPFTSGNKSGAPSPEMKAVADTTNKSFLISWTLLDGASYYRVSRGTAQGSEDGYFQVSTSPLTDAGQSVTPGGAINNEQNRFTFVNGQIVTPAGVGGISFRDFVTGTPYGGMNMTSAGELDFAAGQNGSAAGIYSFLDANSRQLLRFGRSASGMEFDTYYQGTSNLGPLYVVSSSVTFQIGDGSVRNVVISTNGYMTMVNQPSFQLRYTGNTANATGDGTQFNIPWNSEVFDKSNSVSGSTFTAPIGGHYQLCAWANMGPLLAGHSGIRLDLFTSNRTYTDYNEFYSPFQAVEVGGCWLADMDGGDIATVSVKGSGSTKTISVGQGSGDINTFSGHLAN